VSDAPTRRTWIVLGCGYTGERLARRLRDQGQHVIATARRDDAAAALRTRLGDGIEVRTADVFAPATLGGGWIPAGAIVVDSVPPDLERGPHGAHVARALSDAGGGRIVYLSSTGVYARGDGAWVDEDTPTAPEGARGLARVVEEDVYFTAAAAAGAARRLEAVSLRIAAIYGPGRGVQERLRAGAYRVPGDGMNFVSRVHVEDLARVVVAAGSVEPLPRRVFVVGDDLPCRAREHADGVAALLGLPPPASVPIAELSPLAAELGGANRRIRNVRLHAELGLTLDYPTWREGIPASL
jgi:nucleoside-diphosphate-sugar epimerase